VQQTLVVQRDDVKRLLEYIGKSKCRPTGDTEVSRILPRRPHALQKRNIVICMQGSTFEV
jgi:hypothetical protein